MLRRGVGRRGFGLRALVKSAAGPITCAYPLNLSEATLQANGYTGRLTLSNSDQTGDYTIVDSGGFTKYGAAPQTSVTLPATSGKKAVRWRIDQFTASSSGSMQAQVYFYDSTATSDLYHIEYYTLAGGTFQIYVVQGGATTVYTGPSTGSPASNIDLAWNADARVLRIFVDGTEATLSNAGAFTPQALFPVIAAVHGSGATGITSPGHIKTTLVTDAAGMAGATWLSGYTDFCGTAIT